MKYHSGPAVLQLLFGRPAVLSSGASDHNTYHCKDMGLGTGGLGTACSLSLRRGEIREG